MIEIKTDEKNKTTLQLKMTGHTMTPEEITRRCHELIKLYKRRKKSLFKRVLSYLASKMRFKKHRGFV